MNSLAAKTNQSSASAEITGDAPGSVKIKFVGAWTVSSKHPSPQEILNDIAKKALNPKKVTLDFSEVTEWDGILHSLVLKVIQLLTSRSVEIKNVGMPEGLDALIKLSQEVPARTEEKKEVKKSKLEIIGDFGLACYKSSLRIFDFLGESTFSLMRLITRKTRMRADDFFEIISQAGPQALPIVTLISVLVGLIFAFIGAVQLRQFGAQIFVANLVGLAMLREMGVVMVGIIMAGRTGAAFAAQLGTMQVNEEIDALKTLAISPMDFLVLPRMIALILMFPLLTLYADLGGILGGMIVSVGALDISFLQYLEQTKRAIVLTDVAIGVAKSFLFGTLVALCGCYNGMNCGRDASAVGTATTSAVVSSIVCLVICDAICAVIINVLGI